MICPKCGDVMTAYYTHVGHDHVCHTCGEHREYDRKNGELYLVVRCACDQCVHMDRTERGTSRNKLIPGRCLTRGHRITEDEGPCEHYTESGSVGHLRLISNEDPVVLSMEIIEYNRIAREEQKRKENNIKKRTLDGWGLTA